MGSFQTFLTLMEAKQQQTGEEKRAVFTFGRFNPPTRGHKKLVDAVKQIAAENNADPYIFTSHSHDPKKNPLEYDDKIVFMQRLFPEATVINDQQTPGIDSEIKNIFQVVGYLNYLGYTDLILVAGSDRVSEYETRFNRSEEYFDSMHVVSAGERDPDAEGASAMSGTKAREAAVSGDIGKFRAATGWEGEIATQLLKAVRRGMGVDK